MGGKKLPYFIEKKSGQKFSANPMEFISESEIVIPFTLTGEEEKYELSIKNFNNGIFKYF